MSREVVYRGRRIQVEVDARVDSRGVEVRRDVVVHPGAAVILPLLEGDRVCLIRNQRITVGEELLEVPAGTLEPPEPPETCARRELAEETGYRAARWRKLAEYFPSPGVLSERMHLYLAEGLTLGETDLQPGEELHRVEVPFAQALGWAMDGTIKDGKTLVALLLWSRLRG
ncbi:MAG TPA: NUDIX hydrolase [Myxococcales bacterium]|jgi:ADP-ribose pyrophosphatase